MLPLKCFAQNAGWSRKTVISSFLTKTKRKPQKNVTCIKKDAFFEGHGFECDQLMHEQVEVVFNALVEFMHWQENFHPPKHINHRFFLADILDLVLPSEWLAKKGETFKNEQKEWSKKSKRLGLFPTIS